MGYSYKKMGYSYIKMGYSYIKKIDFNKRPILLLKKND